MATRGKKIAVLSATLSAVSACLAAGCVAVYQPGSFRERAEPFYGPQATVGCLDVAVEYVSDAVAVGPVGRFRIGNRCDHPAMVDLAAVRVTARFSDGSVRPMRPFDPKAEIVPLWLDARRVASEYIEYLPIGGASPMAGPAVAAAMDPEAWPEEWSYGTATVEMCLDVAGLDARASAAATVLCLDTPDETVHIDMRDTEADGPATETPETPEAPQTPETSEVADEPSDA